MPTGSVLANAKANGVSFADMLATAGELGEQAGHGKDTQIKFLMKMVEAGYHAAVDLEKDKHGIGVDDCTKLAEAYVKAQTGATIFDAKAANQRKLISCLRTCVKLAQWPKGGTGEPLGTVNQLMTIRQRLKNSSLTRSKVDDAANTLLRYARRQIKLDTLIDKEELEQLCYKGERDNPELMDVLVAQRNALTKLRDGKAVHGTVQDNSPQIIACIDALQDRIRVLGEEIKALNAVDAEDDEQQEEAA